MSIASSSMRSALSAPRLVLLLAGHDITVDTLIESGSTLRLLLVEFSILIRFKKRFSAHGQIPAATVRPCIKDRVVYRQAGYQYCRRRRPAILASAPLLVLEGVHYFLRLAGQARSCQCVQQHSVGHAVLQCLSSKLLSIDLTSLAPSRP